jgi:hypothetical protein
MRRDLVHGWWVRLGPWGRLAVLLWLGVILAVSGVALVQPRRHTVYPIFANAGRNWLDRRDLYGKLRPELDVYRYSPAVAALFAPLASMSDALGGALWRLLSAGVYVAALLWWTRAGLPRALTPAQRAGLFLLALPLSVPSLHNGQSNVLVLGLLLAAVTAATVERWNLAACCLAAACLFKVYPLVVGLLLALLCPRRFATRWVAAAAAGLALPFLLQEPGYVAGQYHDWLASVWGDRRDDRPVLTAYRDLRLLCRVWLTPLGPRTYTLLQVVAGAVIAVVCLACRRAGWPARRLLPVLFILGCCWMTAFGPATESPTYTLLAPGLAWTLLDAWLEERHILIRATVAVGAALFVAAQVALWFPQGASFGSLGPQPLAALLLFAAVLGTAVFQLITGRRTQGLAGDLARAA